MTWRLICLMVQWINAIDLPWTLTAVCSSWGCAEHDLETRLFRPGWHPGLNQYRPAPGQQNRPCRRHA